MLERWTRRVIRFRLVVILAWLVLILLGLLAGSKLNEHLTTSLAVPGTESAKADQILSEKFKENIEGTFTVILKFKNATKAELETLKSKVAAAASTIPTAKVAQQRALGGILFTNVSTSFSLLQSAAYTDRFRQALTDEGLSNALVTGPSAINKDVTPVLASDLKRGQAIAILLALLLLILVLGICWAVLVPFLFAGATISLVLGIVYLIAQKFLMVLYIPNIVELIGLGLAIDYSLLIVHRFRREILDETSSNVDDAILKTMETAGRTVILSGLVVSIGLATLFLVPIPFVRSLGAAGLLVPVISVIATLTLQPAMLSYLGRGGITPKGFKGLLARRDLMTGFFAKASHFVIRRPKSVLLFALAVLAIAAGSVLWLQVTPSALTAIPGNLESSRAISMVTDRVGPGIITPTQLIIDLGKPGLATTPAISKARMDLAQNILKDREVFVVASGQKPPYVDATGQYLRIFVVGRHIFGAQVSQQLVDDLRNKYIAKSEFPTDTKFYLGGVPPQGKDLLKSILASFPPIIFLALLLAYLILVRAFRSVILPLKAIVMDLISIAVAYGSMVVAFRFKVGSAIFGTYQLDQIEAWVLIFLFAVLFGLSMDYEVFIVSRMREAKDRGATNAEAITEGLAHTGGVVTAAAIILISALTGLVIGHIPGLQQLGIGLACGVFIDATVIRGLLLPSAMVLLGRWNWWLPAWVAKLAKTTASPLEERGEAVVLEL
ncbi:MAG TPA: MMPL family transporter [Candidatus Nanopelagicaceae bacterium]